VLTELLRLARDLGVDLLGDPRLVRLNPNIPWKTRGNAALSARFGRGRGPRRRIGEADGRPLWSYRSGRELDGRSAREFLNAAWERVLARARTGDPGTDPAMVAVHRRLPAAFYWQTVREVVPVGRARRLLRAAGAVVRTEGDDRGIVGAAASVAWPARHGTWELIAYREPTAGGRGRYVEASSVRAAQARHPQLFLCHDPRTRRVLIAPHTHCPILFGLRGTDPRAPLRARREIVSEPVERWVLFWTNQGTGDHLSPRAFRALEPYGSAVLNGWVAGEPETLRGGHVRFPIRDDVGESVDCIAFEPTKTLPRVARTLRAGDRVRVWGGTGEDLTFRLEGIRVLHLVPRRGRLEPPPCGKCGGRTRSMGTARGYRCPDCRTRYPPEAARPSRALPRYGPGEYHPTASARRHLHPRAPEV